MWLGEEKIILELLGYCFILGIVLLGPLRSVYFFKERSGMSGMSFGSVCVYEQVLGGHSRPTSGLLDIWASSVPACLESLPQQLHREERMEAGQEEEGETGRGKRSD